MRAMVSFAPVNTIVSNDNMLVSQLYVHHFCVLHNAYVLAIRWQCTSAAVTGGDTMLDCSHCIVLVDIYNQRRTSPHNYSCGLDIVCVQSAY